jgi:hypothetical protein
VGVAALTGSFRVLNARGVLVANVPAGTALAFEPQAPAALTYVTGTLTDRSGHFLLTDRVTRVTVEVTGQRLAAHVGQVVGVSGALTVAATSFAGGSQVLDAASVGTAIGANSVVGGVAVATEKGFAVVSSGPSDNGKGKNSPDFDPPGPPAAPPGQPAGRPPVTPPGPPPAPPGRPPDRPPVSPPGLSR